MNKSRKGIALLACLMLIAIFNNLALMTSKPILGTGEYENNNIKPALEISSFVIDGNWSEKAEIYDWITGDGTPWNPYFIEGITFKGSSSTDALTIMNSDKYFGIINCTIIDANSGGLAGIRLNNVINGRIANCSINNNDNGISIYNSRRLEILDNNITNNDYGIVVSQTREIRIEGNEIYNNNLFGISTFSNSREFEIKKNNIHDNGDRGIYLDSSSKIIISGNNITDHNGGGDYGIYAWQISEFSIENNDIHRNEYAVGLYDTSQGMVESNRIINNSNTGVGINSGGSIIVRKNNFTDTTIPIFLDSTFFNQLSGNIINNTMMMDRGIYLRSASQNTIHSNYIAYFGQEAIRLEQNSAQNKITDNTLGLSNWGIRLDQWCDINTIKGNLIFNNSDIQLVIRDSHSNDITYNTIVNGNNMGIFLESTMGADTQSNTVKYNTIENNQMYGVSISPDAQNNTVILNNFINNNWGGGGLSQANDDEFIGTSNFDDSIMKLGNYWSDWNTPDTNEDGIVDYPYLLDGAATNQDSYPLNYTYQYYNLSILYVDSNFDNTELGWQVTRFSNITSANSKLTSETWFIEKASIIIEEGTYNEAGIQFGRPNIEVVGKSRKKTIIDAAYAGTAFITRYTGITIRNLTVTRGSGMGIQIFSDTVLIENCEIIRNNVGIAVIGQAGYSTQNVKIIGNNISFSSTQGINVLCIANNIGDVRIENNLIYNNTDDGIQVIGGAGYSIWGLQILRNTIENNSDGIECGMNTPNVLIDRNKIINNRQRGVYLTSGMGQDFYTIIKNEFIENGKLGAGTGYAIEIPSGSMGHIIYLNDFIKNNLGSVWLQCIDNNGGLEWSDNSVRLGNYWHNWNVTVDSNAVDPDKDGRYTGPYNIPGGSQDSSPLVNESKYYDLMEIHVDDDYNDTLAGWGATKFNTTQEGINAAMWGAKVYLHAGTYNENIVIDKSLTLIGDGRDNTTIKAKKNGPVINITNSDVTITSLKVINDSIGDSGIRASFVSNINLYDLNITENYDGIYFDNVGNSNITHCVIQGNEGRGIFTFYSNYINIVDNLIAYNTLETNDTININLRNNNFTLAGWVYIKGQLDDGRSHNVENNTVNGQPLHFIVDADYVYHDDNPGEIIWVNVNKSYIYQMNVSGAAIGVLMYYCNDNRLLQNHFDHIGVGFVVIESNYNIFDNNTIDTVLDTGIMLYGSDDNSIFANIIQYGVINQITNGILIGLDTNYTAIYSNVIENFTVGVTILPGSGDSGIFRNDFINNTMYGVATDSYWSHEIHHNNFYDNGNNQSFDGVFGPIEGNLWSDDYMEQGNYWDNYLARYPFANDSDENGAWDTPYSIDGGANAFDNYPLIDPIPFGPFLNILEPENLTWNINAPNVSVEVWEPLFEVVDMWYTINSSSKYFFTDNASIDLFWGTYPLVSTIILEISANNTYGYVNSKSVIIRKDKVAPSISNILYNKVAEYKTGDVDVSAIVIDNYKLRDTNPVQIRFYRPIGTVIGTYNMVKSGNVFTYNWSVGTNEPKLNYYFRIYAYDHLNQLKISNFSYFNITDTVKPSVTILEYDTETEYETGSIYVNTTITDNHKLSSTNKPQVRFYRPDNSVIGTFIMTNRTKGNFDYIWNVGTEDPGHNYYFRIIATDFSGNINNTETGYFDIVDYIYPSVVIDYQDEEAEYGDSEIYISATITDNHEVNTTVQIRFYYPNSTIITNETMSYYGGSSYDHYWSVSSYPPGVDYYFQIIAKDIYGNVNDTEIGYFNITDTEIPYISNIDYETPVEWSTGKLEVTCLVTDNYKLRDYDPVQIRISYANNTLILGYINMTYLGGDSYGFNWSVSGYPIGGYKFRIRAYDNQSNYDTSSEINFEIADGIPPSVILDDSDTEAEYLFGSIGVNVSVTDNNMLRTTEPVQITFYTPGYTEIGTFNMTHSSGDDYWYLWNVGSYIPDTSYSFVIWAYDESDNYNSSVYGYFDITDSQDPTIIIEEYDNEANYGTGSIFINATITDNYQLETPIHIRFYYPNTTLILTNTMSNPSGDTFTYTWNVNSYDPLNGYYFNITAEDSFFNSVIESRYFNITDTVLPTISGPGLTPNPVPTGTNNVSIYATVSDNHKLRTTNPVGIMIYYPNGTLLDYMWLIYLSGNYYNATWDASLYPENNSYKIVFNATDFSGNLRTTNVTFNIITFLDPPPTITNPLVNPTNLEFGNNLTITCNVTDNSAVQWVHAQIYYPNTTLITTVNLSRIGLSTGYTGMWNSSVVGLSKIGNNYYVVINATDDNDNSSWTSNLEFNIKITPPTITNPKVTPSQIEYGGTIKINASITDADGIASATAYLYYPNGTLITTRTLYHIGGGIYENQTSTGNLPVLNDYYVIINATDNKGYKSSSGFKTALQFDIVDTTKPSVIIDFYDLQADYATDTIRVNVSATDNYKLKTTSPVQIKFYKPWGSLIGTFTMIKSLSGDDYWYLWSVGLNAPNISYYFQIIATDAQTPGNVNNTEIGYFNITDVKNPSVSINTYSTSANYGTGSISVSATVTDDYQRDDVLIRFYQPGSGIIGTYTMSGPTGNVYTYNWPVGTQIPGIGYYFRIIANDSSGNVNDSVIRTFNIIDNIKPTIVINSRDTEAAYLIGSISVNATVTDNYKLKTLTPVNISFYYPNSTLIGMYIMNNPSGNYYTYDWSVNSYPISTLDYYFIITATDNQSNTKIGLQWTFKIKDLTAPSVVMDYSDTIIEWKYGTLLVNVTATDNVGVTSVGIKIYSPAKTLLYNDVMVNLGSGHYTQSISVSNVGLYPVWAGYTVNITAIDSASNINNTVSAYFDIIDTISPTGTFTLVNRSYHASTPSYNANFDETVILWYWMTGSVSNITVGEAESFSSESLDSGIFDSLGDDWINITFWFNDTYGNINSIRYDIYKDTTAPSFAWITNPAVMGDIPADKAPTFYIDIDDVNVSEVKYEIPLIYWEDVVYPAGAGLRSSGLISAQNWNNFPVTIDQTVWENLKVEDDYVDIIITITDQAGNSFNRTFAVYRASISEKEKGKDEPPAQDMTMIIIIIIGVAVAAGGGAFAATRRKKPAPAPEAEKKLQIRAPTPKAGKMVDGKLVKAKKAKKKAEEEAKKRPLTPEEKEALAKAEAEMDIEKAKHICVVHKGPIKGQMYLCPQCETLYCLNCARTLKIKGEKCWSCNAKIDVEVSQEIQKALMSSDSKGLLESITKYDATLKKAMQQEKPFVDVPGLEVIDFTLIDPEILRRLDELDLEIQKKIEILKDLTALTPAEQEVLFEAMFLEDEENGN